MRRIFGFQVLAVVALALSATIDAEAKTTYVGGGRYACEGGSSSCAQVKQGNASSDRQKRAERDERSEKTDLYVRESKERQDRLKRSTAPK